MSPQNKDDAWSVNRAAGKMVELQTLGYFTEVDGGYLITEKGRELRDSKWVDHPTREMAENLLKRVIETAEILNEIARDFTFRARNARGGRFRGSDRRNQEAGDHRLS